MHFFGTLGTLCFLTGLGIVFWLIGSKLYDIANHVKYRNITDNTLFYIALVAVILGSQLFLTGFVAEMISRNSPERNNYQIDKTL